MRRECGERFPRHRGLAFLACITARAWPLSDKKPMGFLSDQIADICVIISNIYVVRNYLSIHPLISMAVYLDFGKM